MQDALMQTHHLSKRYGTFQAVEEVSFDIERGEIFGLLGPNGAGKTTTISMLAGILVPTSGEILLGGQPSGRSPASRRLMGIVPQELAIYNRLTARENLAFFGQLYGLRGQALTDRSGDMLRLVGLTERADTRADTYSGGMKRRLNLAVGLMHNPQLLLLDEPTVGVDPQSRNHIFEGVRTLNQAGLTILYTSHYMEEVQALCSRVGIMDCGRLIACDTVANLLARHGKPIIEMEIGVAIVPTALLSQLAQIAQTSGPRVVPTDQNSGGGANLVSVSGTTSRLQIETEQPYQILPELIMALSEARIPMVSLNIKQPGLEDVFLALTGKTLRD